MKFRVILSCMFVFSCFSESVLLYAQTQVADSIRQKLTLEKDPASQTKYYFLIAKELLEKHFDQASFYTDSLEQFARKSKNPTSKAFVLNFKGLIAKESGKLKEALEYFYQDYQIRQGDQDVRSLAMTCNNLGGTYAELFKPDSSIHYYLKSLKIFEDLKEYSNLASAYSNIGNLYNDQKIHDKAINYLEKALTIRLEHGEEKKCMFTYNNLAVAYGTSEGNDEQNLTKALEYSNKGIEIALKYKNNYVAGVIDGGICHILLEKGKYQDAIPHCEQSIKLLTEAKRMVNLVFPYVNLASVYNRLDQPQKALDFAMKGYAIMDSNKLADPLEVYLEEIGTAHEKLGNHKEALVWFKKFMKLDDSLFRSENVRSLADVETKYQSEKKEKELIIERERNYKKTSWLIGFGIFLVAFILITFLLYKRYQYKQDQKLQKAVITEQQLGLNAVIEAQEAERKRIAKDLHDGIVQELVATKLGFDALQFSIQHQDEIHSTKIKDLSQQLNEACTELRNISHVMMPPTLETKGLVPSLQLLLRNSIEQAGIRSEFEHFDLPVRLDEKVELGLYRIAQELLNNILKHAKANKIVMQLYRAGNFLILRVEDDGIGFDFNEARHAGSMGLLNILSRVRTMGGNYFSEKGELNGTISTVRIPI